MTLTRWFLLIGVMAVLGIARVAQRTALWLTAYDVGRHITSVHELENQTQWMGAKLAGAQSPLHLARAARERHLTLVAWSPMPMPVSLIGRALAPVPVTGGAKMVRLVREGDGQNDE